MRVIYVSGPYRAPTKAGIQRNINYARDVATTLWCIGYSVICPHSNISHFPEDKGIDYITGDLEFINRLRPGQDAFVSIPGWEKSKGSIIERECAKNRGLKLWYWPEDEDKIRQQV